VPSVDQAVCQASRDLRERMNNAGINSECIGQAAFAARVRNAAAQYDRVIRQTGIRVEQ
jgi:tripartite-type tricarboxylate transporter receptor subunit TctC